MESATEGKESSKKSSTSKFAPNLKLILKILIPNLFGTKIAELDSTENLDLHPAILELAIRLQDGTLQTANQVTIGTLLQLKQFFLEFELPEDKDLSRTITEDWEKITKFISGSK